MGRYPDKADDASDPSIGSSTDEPPLTLRGPAHWLRDIAGRGALRWVGSRRLATAAPVSGESSSPAMPKAGQPAGLPNGRLPLSFAGGKPSESLVGILPPEDPIGPPAHWLRDVRRAQPAAATAVQTPSAAPEFAPKGPSLGQASAFPEMAPPGLLPARFVYPSPPPKPRRCLIAFHPEPVESLHQNEMPAAPLMESAALPLPETPASAAWPSDSDRRDEKPTRFSPPSPAVLPPPPASARWDEVFGKIPLSHLGHDDKSATDHPAARPAYPEHKPFFRYPDPPVRSAFPEPDAAPETEGDPWPTLPPALSLEWEMASLLREQLRLQETDLEQKGERRWSA